MVTVGVGGTANVLTGTVTGANVTGTLSSSGNVTSAANISGSYISGNGAFLTGIVTGSTAFIGNGTSNVNIATSSGDGTVGVGGNCKCVDCNYNRR